MSKRLSYLSKARPEAATAYMTFLKESGRHLDDKTRFLISVVTKVISGTAPGLKQYVPHAMRCGATANEVFDAILMAMPAAGLPKVLDALDILQELGPEFSIENLAKEPEWCEVGPVEELPMNELVAKEVSGSSLLVYRGEALKVYHRECPHSGKPLPESCEGRQLTCPAHKWEFDVETGEVTGKGSRNLHEVPFKVEDGVLLVELLVLE